MRDRRSAMMKRLFVLAIFSSAFIGTAMAQAPQSLGEFKDWTAWTFTGNKGKVCYMHAAPSKLQPDRLNHGDVSFFIRISPGEGITNEANFVVGYPFQEQSNVTVEIDGRTFTMFTQAESAWLVVPDEEAQLLTAMRAGKTMTVKGTSQRGNATTYGYSLSGATAASDKIKSECQ